MENYKEVLRSLRHTNYYEAYVEFLQWKVIWLQSQLRNTKADYVVAIAKLQWHIQRLEELFLFINNADRDDKKWIHDTDNNKKNYFWSLFSGLTK